MTDAAKDKAVQHSSVQQESDKPTRSQWRDIWDQFKSHRGALFGGCLFLFICLGVIVGPFIYWNDAQFVPTGRDFIKLRDMRPIYHVLWDPSAKMDWAYPLGTDNLGRDTLARLMFGGRVSLAVGMAAMILALLLGSLVGVVAGYFKKLDGLLMRLTDLFLALPLLPMILVAAVLFRESLSKSIGLSREDRARLKIKIVGGMELFFKKCVIE